MKRARRRSPGLLKALLVASALSSTGLALAQGQPAANHVPVSALPITRFQGVDPGGAVGGLVWRGGIALTSDDDRFGGLSGMGILGPDGRMVMVSDRGNFVTGQLLHDDAGRPSSVVGVDIIPMRNSAGVELPRASARDAEAMDVVIRDGIPVAIRVGFENVTRVADFRLVDGVPGGAAREVNMPAWLSRERSNETLEALCIAPPASPVAGSTLLIAEGLRDADGNARATL
ncbi:MAG: esterase-like activity of phytase family protein, partial [Devosia sp.]